MRLPWPHPPPIKRHYEPLDPETGRPWPPMLACFLRLAHEAATQAEFAGFLPDACLINRYTNSE